MIWDYIRDFLVQYIFGGYTSGGVLYSTYIGNGKTTTDFGYAVGTLSNGQKAYVSIGDWLSTTATIIIMCLAVFLMIMLVRWVWRLVTSAFLLK